MLTVRGALEALGIALFPSRCGACRQALPFRPPLGLCPVCQEILEPNLQRRCPGCDLPDQDGACLTCRREPPPFAAVRAPYVYGGAIADLIVAAKFRGREDLAVALARLMLEDDELHLLAAGCTALVPVPLGRRRARQRGYNQAAILARALARALNRDPGPDRNDDPAEKAAPATRLRVRHALRRTRDTTPQSDLPLAARHANVRGAFTARLRLTGKVALVDDVITSGTTVREAAAALLAGGATEVVVLAAARASLPEPPGR